MPNLIHVTSLDYDQCLARRGAKNIIEENATMLDVVKGLQIGFDQKILFIGSNRQAVGTDLMLASQNQNGLSFVEFLKINAHLGTEFDPFTIGDLYLDEVSLDLKHGSNVEIIQDKFKDIYNGPNSEIDYFTEGFKTGKVIELSTYKFTAYDKINVLYAQMCKVAAAYPATEITFDFWDDKDDILAYIAEFFNKYKDTMLPHNVKLRLFNYAGTEIKLYKSEKEHLLVNNDDLQPVNVSLGIKGQAKIDHDWKNTVKNMCKIGYENNQKAAEQGELRLSLYITPELLFNKKEEPEAAASPSKTKASYFNGEESGLARRRRLSAQERASTSISPTQP